MSLSFVPPVWPGVVQAPELAERRVVRCRGDRHHVVRLCVGHPRIAREGLDGERLLVVLHLHEDGVDLAEALLRGRAGVFQDRVLLGPRDALGEADDQLALDRLRRLLRRGRDRSHADAEDDGGCQDEKRKRAGHVPKRIIWKSDPPVYPTTEKSPARRAWRNVVCADGRRYLTSAAAIAPRPRLEPDATFPAELAHRIEDDPSKAVPLRSRRSSTATSPAGSPLSSSARTTVPVASAKDGTNGDPHVVHLESKGLVVTDRRHLVAAKREQLVQVVDDPKSETTARTRDLVARAAGDLGRDADRERAHRDVTREVRVRCDDRLHADAAAGRSRRGPNCARSSSTTGAKRFSKPSSREWPTLCVTIRERIVGNTSRPMSTAGTR